LFPDQEQTIKHLQNGNSLVYNTRTGGGKNSIPKLYSLLNPDSFIVVISPYKSLIKDYYSSLIDLFPGEVDCFFADGSRGQKNQDNYNQVKRNIRTGQTRILVVTAEQLRIRKDFVATLSERGVDLLVVDECHNILTSGATGFRLAWRAVSIGKIIRKLKDPKTLFMSATIDHRVQTEIRKAWGKGKLKQVTGDLVRPNLGRFHFRFDNRGQKLIILDRLLEFLKKKKLKKGIIFFATVNNLEHVHSVLSDINHETSVYFGRKSSNITEAQKNQNIEEFMGSKKGILLATAAFGEGINIQDVDFVIIFDVPGSLIELDQWSGRAGRDNKPAPIILMEDGHGHKLRQHLIEGSKDDKDEIKQELYDELRQFLESDSINRVLN